MPKYIMAAHVTNSLGKIKLTIQNYPENKYKTKADLAYKAEPIHWQTELLQRTLAKASMQKKGWWSMRISIYTGNEVHWKLQKQKETVTF